MIVQWAPVIGYEGLYQVCNLGYVFSFPRQGSRGGLLRSSFSEGYPMVALSNHGQRKSHKIHQLVLEAFDGPCPPGQECRHLDGNRLNNVWPENLEWGTPGENGLDRTRHGTNPSLKISDYQLADAFHSWEGGTPLLMVARELGVSDVALRRRLQRLDAARYERLSVGNKKVSDSAVLVYYERWRAGESKSSLAREAGVDPKALRVRFRLLDGT